MELHPDLKLKSEHPYIILDSGAYSIWRSGQKVDFQRYYDYCDIVKDKVLTCVNLDVIPGAWGRGAQPQEIEEACEVSFGRFVKLKETGARIMPVYHQNDKLVWLDKLLDAGAEYIGISPTDSYPAAIRQKWLVDVHNYMVKRGVKLNSKVFTHALGVFAPRVMRGVPLWSADASTLLRYVAMKRILIPRMQLGRIHSWDAVYVGSRHLKDPQLVDWEVVKGYLAEVSADLFKVAGVHVEYTTHPISGRVLIDDPIMLILINLYLAKKAMMEVGVRCFVAGQHPLAIWAVTVLAQYPYILRTFAVIKEKTGVTIDELYNRSIPKPNRRPEKDRKVETPRGLFPQ